MGQSEVFNTLRDRRIFGEDKFFSHAEIYNIMLSKDNSISRNTLFKDLKKLHAWGYLEIRYTHKHTKHNKAYRVKEYYL